MGVGIENLQEHEGQVLMLLDDGSETEEWDPTSAPIVLGFRPGCSCGWRGSLRPNEGGGVERQRDELMGQWYRQHAQPLLHRVPPATLLVVVEELRHRLAELVEARPLAILAALRRIGAWTDELTLAAVTSARAHGASWADVGEAIGITKQAAHERFSSLIES